jgi:hypothetical protein
MEQVLVVAGVMELLLVAAIFVGGFLVARGVRRRYRSLRWRLEGVLRHSGTVAESSLGSPAWWAVQGRRHQMWQAVTSAEHAVTVARRAEVPVGDLPALARRLHVAATGADAVLRAGGRTGALRIEDRTDCDRIVAAAEDLRTAAMTTLRARSHADADSLVSAVRIEVAALAAGLRAARE